MRAGGILMHLSSLPSPYGIGTMGAAARDFVDFLALGRADSTGRSCLYAPPGSEILPISPFPPLRATPISSTWMMLAAEGLLLPEEYRSIDWGGAPDRQSTTACCTANAIPFCAGPWRGCWPPRPTDTVNFATPSADWLPDYALFMAPQGRPRRCALVPDWERSPAAGVSRKP